MTLDPGDRAEIAELLARHGHLFDDGALDRLDLLFTASIRYDVSAFGGGVLAGIEAIRAATLALAGRNPVGHHVTNVDRSSPTAGAPDRIGSSDSLATTQRGTR